MILAYADIETDGLDPSVIHCCVVKYSNQERPVSVIDEYEFERLKKPDKWVFHNGLNFDVPVLNRLWNAGIDSKNVIDTMVVSKLVDYKAYATHSLAEIGKSLGVYKGDFKGPWDKLTLEMFEYCEQDVLVLEAIFKKFKPYVYDKSWAKAMRLEHDMAVICQQMESNGFKFDVPKAVELLYDIKTEMTALEQGFQSAFPPVLKEVNRIKYRTKKDGSLFTTVTSAQAFYPKTEVVGDELVCYDWHKFNPGSPKDRIDKLWEHGWNPVNKTKGYKKFEKGLRDERRYLHR